MGIGSAFMQQTITVAPKGGTRNEYAERSSGTQRTVSCRIEYNAADIRDADGNIIDTGDVIYSHDTIGEDEFIWLPGADTTNDAEARTPESVGRSPSVTGGDDLWKVVV